MTDLQVDLKLDRIACYDEGDGPGNAEPYLWTVFFKVDGETLVVNSDGPAPPFLQGFPTVIGTRGNHGNLGTTDVDADDVVPIPAILGEYHTVMKPIPLTTPMLGVSEVGGMIGCLVVLLEEDNTPTADIGRGHDVLDSQVRDGLTRVLSTLSISKLEVTDEDITALSDAIAGAVKEAIEDGVTIPEWLFGFGDMDDQIGSAVFRFSHNQLQGTAGAPIPFSRRWENEGDWELFGGIAARALPRRDDCCEELRRKTKGLEAQIAELGKRLKSLERRLFPPPVRPEGMIQGDTLSSSKKRRPIDPKK